MSEITMYKCDGCGEVCENHYAQKGWIHFDNETSINVALGEYDKDYNYYKGLSTDTVRDFCNWTCFKNHLMHNKEAEKKTSFEEKSLSSFKKEKK